MNYDQYREQVELACDGANVHRVNGRLGLIINSICHYGLYAERSMTAEADRVAATLNECFREIHRLVGVSIPISVEHKGITFKSDQP